MISDDEKFMQRCLDLAKKGTGSTSPNPMVGSVVVYKGKIIGEGYHIRCGEAHAEVNAVRSVNNQDLLHEATLYVNLEPCAHVGRTPACSLLIIEKKIPRVVIGCTDPFEKVAGKGIEMLQNAGIDVTVGILEQESMFLNRRFFTFHTLKRPYIILKWAQSLDGFIDFRRDKNTPVQPNWITDEYARMLVHKWRAEEDAIMVGTNTAEKDNPRLDVRNWHGKNPVRIVIDRNLRLNHSLELFSKTVQTLVFTEKKREPEPGIEYIQIAFDGKFLPEMMRILYEKHLLSIIVEGGSYLINSLVENGLWDEARYFVGKKLFFDGVKAPQMSKMPENVVLPGNSTLYVVTKQG